MRTERARATSRRRLALFVASLLVLGCLRSERAWAGCARKGFGTLAYVVSNCRAQGTSIVAWQELRIRRGRCEPVTVMRVANPTPVEDPFGLCERVAQNHFGNLSSLAGVFQRLAVTPDGSAVLFEVSNQFQLVERTPLTEQDQGFFWVRADGTGLRRLGPPSGNPVYRIFPDPLDGDAAAASFTEMASSPDGRLFSFPGRGPGPDGVDREQLFIINVRTGERRQLTSLPTEEPRPFGRPAIAAMNVYRDRVDFVHHVGARAERASIGLDGRNYRTYPQASVPDDVGGGTIPAFGVAPAVPKRWSITTVERPGTAVTADLFPGPIREVANVVRGKLIQLTNLGAADTYHLYRHGRTVLFWSSADPFGTNPWRNKQIFRVSLLGAGLRQLTHFANAESLASHVPGDQWGCFLEYVNQGGLGRGFYFYSDCDPFGSNLDGSEVFVIDPRGHLEQLTDTAGVRRHADGVLEVELPGPMARGS